LWQLATDSGFGMALAGEDSGGLGASWSAAYPILRGLGYWQVPLPLAETMIGSMLLSMAGLEVPQDPITVIEQGRDDTLSVDCRQVKPDECADDPDVDQWLCRWAHSDIPNMGQVKEFPLRSWADFDRLPVPDITEPRRWEQLKGARERAGPATRPTWRSPPRRCARSARPWTSWPTSRPRTGPSPAPAASTARP
jgi:hypothetical protein